MTPQDAQDEDIDDDLPEASAQSEGQVVDLNLPPDAAGERLDRALMAVLGEAAPDISRARLQTLIAEGRLTFEGHIITDGKHKAKAGHYALTIPAPIAALPQPQNLALEILYEDAHLIVVIKPAGMAAHPAPGTPDGTLVNALLHHCGDTLSGIGGVLRPGIVHRLDKDTSGVMVAAKSDAAHHGLSALFSKHDIGRAYLAIVRGTPKATKGTVTTQIGRSHHDRKKMAVLRAGGREATTHYTVQATFGGAKPIASLIRCELETGRTHQIRVHMAHVGAPCLGDPVYGSGAPAAPVQALLRELNFTRQALHATHLAFVHPITGEALSFDAPPPADFQNLLTGLTEL
ncbi:RluA family pseudouridine synthase [Asticcacaulis sp. ZE23SCel15]|uniref:RluA family pseudouridine synthase n=1 Tax=Asticcacaulis sp. ZE23SCel15 TaxID=3059027 RepID=UPI00265DFB80|nr:RluA family pseudouridine synthase [Asticcacaulis sp. ZE23SCel15]WKL58539.1 RluA family pseudouridine synthase [Asticcacaulis sp. ZE23SCel15]